MKSVDTGAGGRAGTGSVLVASASDGLLDSPRGLDLLSERTDDAPSVLAVTTRARGTEVVETLGSVFAGSSLDCQVIQVGSESRSVADAPGTDRTVASRMNGENVVTSVDSADELDAIADAITAFSEGRPASESIVVVDTLSDFVDAASLASVGQFLRTVTDETAPGRVRLWAQLNPRTRPGSLVALDPCFDVTYHVTEDETSDAVATGTSNTADLLQLLSQERRRHVLYHLVDADEPIAISDLCVAVAERMEGPEVTDDERRRIAISIRHVDAPKLEDVGFARIDTDRNTIALESTAAELEPFLEILQVRDGRPT